LRAESILQEKKADLIGLARMLWVDPDWPKKAREGRDNTILKCSSKMRCMFQTGDERKACVLHEMEKGKAGRVQRAVSVGPLTDALLSPPFFMAGFSPACIGGVAL